MPSRSANFEKLSSTSFDTITSNQPLDFSTRTATLPTSPSVPVPFVNAPTPTLDIPPTLTIVAPTLPAVTADIAHQSYQCECPIRRLCIVNPCQCSSPLLSLDSRLTTCNSGGSSHCQREMSRLRSGAHGSGYYFGTGEYARRYELMIECPHREPYGIGGGRRVYDVDGLDDD